MVIQRGEWLYREESGYTERRVVIQRGGWLYREEGGYTERRVVIQRGEWLYREESGYTERRVVIKKRQTSSKALGLPILSYYGVRGNTVDSDTHHVGRLRLDRTLKKRKNAFKNTQNVKYNLCYKQTHQNSNMEFKIWFVCYCCSARMQMIHIVARGNYQYIPWIRES